MNELIKHTIDFVKKELTGAESGHDWWHTYRVWKLADTIAHKEQCHRLTVNLAALLHDISDAKLNGGDEEKAINMARTFLEKEKVDPEIIDQVLYIIENISFRKNIDASAKTTPELAVVMDADRLDAMGAIGIARTFNYGGFKNRRIYDPDEATHDTHNYETYTKNESHTIQHFYDKLLKLKDLMHTKTGKAMAEERHQFMVEYLERFYKEWDGKI